MTDHVHIQYEIPLNFPRNKFICSTFELGKRDTNHDIVALPFL